MPSLTRTLLATALLVGGPITTVGPAGAATFLFSTGNATNALATASRPGPASGANQETESADDFVLAANTRITSLSFTGLLPVGVSLASVSRIVTEIYRVFPSDSNVARTSGPPTFSTPQVPTRVNSPADAAYVSRDSALAGNLSYSTALLSSSLTALNSVDNGINPSPNQTTGGEGAVTGQVVRFDVTLLTPVDLPADHYFFVPQVLLADPDDHFLWLSAERPITTGTAFDPDLQAWVRNARLDPDWLRVGTDILGRGTFNLAFTLNGETGAPVPEPGTYALLIIGMAGVGFLRRRDVGNTARRRQAAPEALD